MKSWNKIWKRLVLLAMCLSVTASGLPGLVVCIGHDGHVALEAAHSGLCHDTHNIPEHYHGESMDVLSDGDSNSLAECFDVTFSSMTILPRISKGRSGQLTGDELAGFLCVAHMRTSLYARLDLGPPDGPPPDPLLVSSSLRTLRSIVLRT